MTLPDRYFRILRKKRVRKMLDDAGVQIPDFILEVLDDPTVPRLAADTRYARRKAREAAERAAAAAAQDDAPTE